jgi:hypothetical protein
MGGCARKRMDVFRDRIFPSAGPGTCAATSQIGPGTRAPYRGEHLPVTIPVHGNFRIFRIFRKLYVSLHALLIHGMYGTHPGR